MVKFRLRVKRSSHAPKPPNGSSSSNNPKTTKYRNSARAQRIANICPLIAVDERTQIDQPEETLIKQLPLGQMTINDKKRRNGSVYSGTSNKKFKHTESENLLTSDDINEKFPFNEMSLDNKRKFLQREHQLWAILPANLSTSLPDYQSTMPILAPILGAALNERPDLRLTALNSIRSAIQIDIEHGFDLMRRYAKNFLPILFSLYTNDDCEEGNEIAYQKMDPKAVHQSALSTIRLYMRLIPPELLRQYITIALKKFDVSDLQKSENMEKNFLLADIVGAMCSSATMDELQMIFDAVVPWFDHNNARLQKKAYRVISQIFQRINETELKPFFVLSQSVLIQLMRSHQTNSPKSAYQWRVTIFRNMIDSFAEFDSLMKFCHSIFDEIVALMDTGNNTATRHQAANCLLEISEELLRLWTSEGLASANPVNCLITKLFNIVKFATMGDKSDTTQLQCALIALNILSQKHIRHMDATLISQLITHSSKLLQSSDPQCRVLAIRLMRQICTKIQPFMFEQYKDLILAAVFSQPIKGSTVRIRKSNALLLNLLLDRLGIETLIKFVVDNKVVWTKMLKNLEKMRRRRQRKKGGMEAEIGNETTTALASLPSTIKGMSATPSVISVGATSAISTLISSLGVKTANADSIFNVLDESSDDEERDKQSKNCRLRRRRQDKTSNLSLVIEEDEDEIVDLLDHESLKNKVSIVNSKNWKKDEMKRTNLHMNEKPSGPFPTNKEGKLLIKDLDERRTNKRRQQPIEEKDSDVDMEEKPKKATVIKTD